MPTSINNSALPALKAFATRLRSNANNIANANTEGYKKSRVTLAEMAAGGVATNIERINSPGTIVLEETSSGQEEIELSNVDLARELPEMNINRQLYKANLKSIQVADEMLGSLLEIKA